MNLAAGTIVPLAIIVIAAALVVWSRRAVTTIYAPFVGLLYRNGRFERELPPGRYAWFDPFARRRVAQVSTAEVPIVLPDITVLSKDRFSFRLALSPIVATVDARRFAEAQSPYEMYPHSSAGPVTVGHAALSPLVAAATLETVSTRTLAGIMADPASVTAAIEALLVDAVPGATVTRVLLTGINLPPETRKMFTDVERAKVEAQGALERARGEQAALRVLANAARLVSDNPALANLRLLQAIESSKGSTTIIVGDAVASPASFPARPGPSSAP